MPKPPQAENPKYENQPNTGWIRLYFVLIRIFIYHVLYYVFSSAGRSAGSGGVIVNARGRIGHGRRGKSEEEERLHAEKMANEMTNVPSATAEPVVQFEAPLVERRG